MAPRKVASPAKPRRVTRARAADAAATTTVDEPPKRKTTTKAATPTTTSAKASEAKSRVTKKMSTTTNTKAHTRSARSTKSAPVVEAPESDAEEEADEVTVTTAQPPAKASRASSRTTTTHSAATTSSLAAAPRRRIKVTPLDAVINEPAPTQEVEKKPKKSSSKTKKEKLPLTKSITSSRGKRNLEAANLDEAKEDTAENEIAEPVPKKRGRARANTVEVKDDAEVPQNPVEEPPKTRGRPKRVQAEPIEEKPVVLTRQTRARAGSSTSAPSVEPIISVVVPRKKVTFQDIPDEEDEKENVRPPTKTAKKAAAASAKKVEPAARGMRAKPIRKSAVTATAKSSRGRTATKAIKDAETDAAEKIQQRALTPKKITQVAKASAADSDESEDELAGAKTPVRDLSLSPKRGINASITRPLSPVKKLDFTPALSARPHSPGRSESLAFTGISSPPRRNPASPAKESLNNSPRRAPDGVTVFRVQIGDTSNSASLALNSSNAQTQLLQSPKRGLTDALIFPHSAAKLSKSPFKASLLSSPARRLFSPSKQKTPSHVSPSPIKKASTTPLSEARSIKSPGNVDLMMTSHFRSSVSPQRSVRVHTMSEDELAQEMGAELDFDQSVLNVRSPLKVDKVKTVVIEPTEQMEVDAQASDDKDEDMDNAQQDEEDGLLEPINAATVEDDAIKPIETNAVNDETLADPELEEDENDDVRSAETQSERLSSPVSESEDSILQHAEVSVKQPRISNVLFSRLRDREEDSEDELAADQTPEYKAMKPSFRSSLIQPNTRSRLSTGIAPPSASRNIGFTPLAAQVRGWSASSPLKKVKASDIAAQSRGLFSPVAQMHVEGAVELSRQETPVRSASKRKSLASLRQSLGPSVTGSPANHEFFAESMAAQDFEDQNEDREEESVADGQDLHDLIQEDMEERNLSSIETLEPTEDLTGDEDANESEELEQEPGDITTDLIKFTKASDTAMVDFKALADEAEQLAGEQGDEKESTSAAVGAGDEDASLPVPAARLEVVDEEPSHLSTSSDNFADENVAPYEELGCDEPASPTDEQTDVALDETVIIHHQSPEAPSPVPEITLEQDEKSSAQPSEIEASNSIAISPSGTALSTTELSTAVEPIDFNVTPVRPDPSLPRYVNTVVSKIPLRPEGDVRADVSPLKVSRKRARSLSSATTLVTKRRSLGMDQDALEISSELLATPKASQQFTSSPQRRIRSAAPSPAQSLLTTPGQMSFAIDDFGDSTLDGIELPEDELMSDDVDEDATSVQVGGSEEHDDTVMTIGSTLFKTPIAPAKRQSLASSSVHLDVATPRYAMSTKSRKSRGNATPAVTPSRAGVPKTPATAGKAKTPATTRKGKTPAKTPIPTRTPLKPVEEGVLTGAVVHVDVHTSEGADASGIFVELLTTMGARCVRDWKWSPHISIAPTSGEQEESGVAETPGSSISITHVVYKDGGKRTLEKVRAAKGQVLCVGVGWVLDCERESKWLDEAPYAVDSSIMPRGGSRRRKSMEPRMLINANGLLSAKRESRRSVSAEYAGLTNEMRLDLINTPVRGREVLFATALGQQETTNDNTNAENGAVNADIGDETDISSTYNSPTAATVGGGGDTADLRFLISNHDAEEGQQEEEADLDGTPQTKFSSLGTNISTPQTTSLAVDYDPRTAATPLTPYLVAKGKELMQMSAPPKQMQRGLFERDEDGDSLMAEDGENSVGADGAGGEMKKFQVKMNGVVKGKAKGKDVRRRTLGVNLGFKPVVGSPLRKQE